LEIVIQRRSIAYPPPIEEGVLATVDIDKICSETALIFIFILEMK